jgi:integrase
LNGQG